jgi:hypothetical protein
MDGESEMSSRFFAILCHSWIYQPSLANKSLSTLEMTKELLRHGRVARRAIAGALDEYRRHRWRLKIRPS